MAIVQWKVNIFFIEPKIKRLSHKLTNQLAFLVKHFVSNDCYTYLSLNFYNSIPFANRGLAGILLCNCSTLPKFAYLSKYCYISYIIPDRISIYILLININCVFCLGCDLIIICLTARNPSHTILTYLGQHTRNALNDPFALI